MPFRPIELGYEYFHFFSEIRHSNYKPITIKKGFQCSLTFSELTDSTAFNHKIIYVGENNVDMWGPEGWEENVLVTSYIVQFDDSQDVIINVDKKIEGTSEDLGDLGDYAWKLAVPLGRIPIYARLGVKRIDVNHGKFSYY